MSKSHFNRQGSQVEAAPFARFTKGPGHLKILAKDRFGSTEVRPVLSCVFLLFHRLRGHYQIHSKTG